MNVNGILRRVDELGRVVIPVEIRRILNIKDCENLEFVINNDKIELKKKSCFDYNRDYFKDISDKLSQIIIEKYFISDRERIIFSNNNELLNKKLDSNICNYVNNYEDTNIENTKLTFDDINILSTWYIFPYMLENDIAGYIVLYDVCDINKYKKLIKFITLCIHDKLSL